MPWPQIVVGGEGAAGVPASYSAAVQKMFLIDPQGTLVAKNLDAQHAYYLIDKLLSHRSEAIAGVNVKSDFLPTRQATPTSPYGAVPAPQRTPRRPKPSSQW